MTTMSYYGKKPDTWLQKNSIHFMVDLDLATSLLSGHKTRQKWKNNDVFKREISIVLQIVVHSYSSASFVMLYIDLSQVRQLKIS